MILAACLPVPALAEQVIRRGEGRVRRGVRLVAARRRAPSRRPAVIGLHGCGGLYARGD